MASMSSSENSYTALIQFRIASTASSYDTLPSSIAFSPHSRIRNQINQSTFSVNAIMMAQAHKISVSAIARPRNLPIFVQTSVILINPFETCEISDANMTTIAMMNWTERHQTGQMVLRILGITIGMPIVKFLLAKSALVSRIIKRLHPTHLLTASTRHSAAFNSKIAASTNSGSQCSKWFRATSKACKASRRVLTVVGIGSMRNIFLTKSAIFRSISTPPHLHNLPSREPALDIIMINKC
nr:MAG TPA_asm: hypothetical protein [Caudoviricetes sp.]